MGVTPPSPLSHWVPASPLDLHKQRAKYVDVRHLTWQLCPSNYGCSVLQITLQKYALFHAKFF